MASVHLYSSTGGNLTLLPDNIPPELKERAQWVCWRVEWRIDNQGMRRPTKVPVNARTGAKAATDDPRTWSEFDAALAAAYKAHGIGFVFSETDPFFGLDLDGCRHPDSGEIMLWAQKICHRFPTYQEISVTGTGIHIIGEGKLNSDAWHKRSLPRETRCGEKMPAIEVYDRRRFFTMSGHTLSANR
jgi:putative DNA primase/helicase